MLFFLLVWLYLWRVVDLRLIAHCAGPVSGILPVFYRGGAFFREFVGRPGGLVEYAGAFLFQLFSPAWLGAIVVTGLAWMLALCVSACFTMSGSPHLRCLRYVPAFLVLAIYSCYTHCIISIVALLAALCVVPAYLSIGATGTTAAMVFFIAVSPVLYHLAGAAYLVFAATCILYETLVTRRWRVCAACIPAAIAVPFLVGVALCGTPAAMALTPYAFSSRVAIPGHPFWAVCFLYLLVPAGMLVSRGAGRMRGWPARTIPPRLRHAGLVLPFVLAAATAFFSFAPAAKAVRAVDFYADCGMWDRVLDAARADPSNPPIVQTVNRALCHTGRLADDLFSHPQSMPALLIDPNADMSWQWMEIWLDAGFVNAAEHHLAQAMEILGEQPAILQKLALIHLAKGNTGTARIYLNALARSISQDAWARRQLSELEKEPDMAHDQRIQWLRSTMPTNAVLIKERMPDEWFLALLERNPTNRPAFEHLMTLCLVAARPDLVARNIYRMDKFGYPRPYLPEHYAEAVVALMARTGAQPELHGWQIRADTQRRFQECMEVARRYKGDSPAIERELWKRFPGSYFRYLLVGEEGRP